MVLSGLALEELDQARFTEADAGVVPFREQLRALGGGQHGKLGHRPARIRRDFGEQRLEVARQSPQAGGVEEIGAVEPFRLDASRRIPAVQHQVERRDAAGDLQRLDVETRQPHRFLGGALKSEADLKQRVAARIPLLDQRFDQLLEGRILVEVGFERGRSDAGEQLFEGRRAGQVAAQGEHVDEEADQSLELGTVAVGDRKSDQEIALSGVAIEQRLIRRQQGHELGDAMLAGKLLQLEAQVARDAPGSARAAETLTGGTATVGGELEYLRSSPQLVGPIAQLSLDRLVLEPLALPTGEVAILDGQRWQRRGAAARERSIKRFELAIEDPDRPTVGDDVVGEEQQDVTRGPGSQKQRPEQLISIQVEGSAALRLAEARDLALLGRRRHR